MPTHNETKILPYSAQCMYDLVADVASYPEFLPWCAAARVKSVTDEGSRQIMAADLVISFKVFRERFGSQVILHPDEKFIDTQYLDGPFKYMKSTWKFEDVPEGCAVTFFVDFEFKNAFCKVSLAWYLMKRCCGSFGRLRPELMRFTQRTSS